MEQTDINIKMGEINSHVYVISLSENGLNLSIKR